MAKLLRVKVPVKVVSIVGKYRTGKSYLMNILAGSTKGILHDRTLPHVPVICQKKS